MIPSLDLEHQLTRFQEELGKKFKGFPRGCCTAAAEEIASLLGLEVKHGLFVDDLGFGNPHTWNEADGILVDVTSHQFRGGKAIYIDRIDSPNAVYRYVEGVMVGY